MSETVIVKSFGEGRPWSSPDGKTNLTFFETVFVRAGADFKANWGKKSSGPPEVGAPVEGEFFQKNGEWRFRIASQGGGSSGSRSGGGGEYMKPQPPDAVARMGRAHAQEIALRFLALNSSLKAKYSDKAQAPFSYEQVFEAVDRFEADVDAAGKAAQGAGSVGGTPSSLPSAPREASPAPAQAPLELGELLEGAGFTPAQTTVVERYIEDKFDPSQRVSAEASLKDPERVNWVKQKLTAGAEQWAGEPLPVTTPEDDSDIPF